MIYMIGGSPRAGKSVLGQHVAAQLAISWTSTDLLVEPLRAKNVAGLKTEWDASPEAITAAADWFFPCLDRFLFGVNSMVNHYVVDGVDFLPHHISQLQEKYPIKAVFIGCEQMTIERFDRYPGRSPGYSFLPETLRQRMAADVPLWSVFVREEADRWGYPYVDMSDNFAARLDEAAGLLMAE